MLVVNAGKGRITKTPRPNIFIHDAPYGAERVHANEKPVALYEDIITSLTFAGDTVCDTFFGSGNSIAAAARTSRIPWGCDKNPEMLRFALAKARGQAPISKAMIEASFKRYQDGLSMEVGPDDVSDSDEVGIAGVAQPTNRASSQQFFPDEPFKVDGVYLCYILYDGHNMAQTRGESEEKAYEKAEADCEILNRMTSLGLIDPCCDSPDEVQAALTEWKKEKMNG